MPVRVDLKGVPEIAWTEESAARISAIHAAVRAIAARCDGAHARDGEGFGMMDKRFGHDLAKAKSLTLGQARAARRMLKKYHRQLADAGIPWEGLKEP